MLTRRSAAWRRRQALSSLALVALLLSPTAARGQNPVFIGLYQWGNDLPSLIANFQEFDAWIAPTGRRVAVAGDFLNIEYAPGVAVPQQLGVAWDNGRIPFVKILSSRSAAEIANGVIDPAIAQWGRSFALWSEGGKKRAFLAPLPEMNGNWIPYYAGGSIAGGLVIQAWMRIRNIISAELQTANVPQNAISWVFAPNGWSLPGDEFEYYYPGHDHVDVVAFSGYNWGACPQWQKWETFDDVFAPYLPRMRAMAPGKPIFIAETAVIDRPSQPIGDRNQWLRDSYTRLGAYPALRGIVYFNLILPNQANLPNCPNPDFRMHIPGTDLYYGLKDAIGAPQSRFGYWAPTSPEVTNIVFAPTFPRLFADVQPIHPFALDPGQVDYSRWIHRLAVSGVTTGCSTSPPLFCPTTGVTRNQMAVFLLRALHGPGYTPPPATGTMFADVGLGDSYAPWIEQLAVEGITGGCGGGMFCPDSPVTRAQMAVFLLRAVHGGTYTPPPATGMVFADVPAGHFFGAWIEQLAASGITGGCGGGSFCPDATIIRQQMAVFLVRAFNLAP